MGVQRRVLGRQEGGSLGGQDRRRGQVVVAEGKKNRALQRRPHIRAMLNGSALLFVQFLASPDSHIVKLLG